MKVGGLVCATGVEGTLILNNSLNRPYTSQFGRVLPNTCQKLFSAAEASHAHLATAALQT